MIKYEIFNWLFEITKNEDFVRFDALKGMFLSLRALTNVSVKGKRYNGNCIIISELRFSHYVNSSFNFGLAAQATLTSIKHEFLLKEGKVVILTRQS